MNNSKYNLKAIMTTAWQFVKKNGLKLAEALKLAWLNAKTVKAMTGRIVKFWYTKIDGTLREAYGTLNEATTPATKGTGRKVNESLQAYYDTEKEAWRSFKKANLVKAAF